jgi:spore maturation protein CgeB
VKPTIASNSSSLHLVVLGLSITSSWGNGHATTYRSLLREMAARGHRVHFLERDVPWYASNRDAGACEGVTVDLYGSREELQDRFAEEVRQADGVVVGSYVPEGVAVGDWVQATAGGLTAFYDIDTPVTLGKLARGDEEYLSPDLIPRFDMYLSFTGGPTLRRLEQEFGARRAEALYCAVDESRYRVLERPRLWDLGYLGTYSDDRQPTLERLLIEPARRLPQMKFVVAGPQYPSTIDWPANVERIEHLPPERHPDFYASQRFTLNVTRKDMIAAGWSPSVRLFEAGACGVPIISDHWDGLDSLFPEGAAIVIGRSSDDVVDLLQTLPDEQRRRIGRIAQDIVLKAHTGTARASELVGLVGETRARSYFSASITASA